MSTYTCQHFLPFTITNCDKSKLSTENKWSNELIICDEISSPPLPWNSGVAFAELNDKIFKINKKLNLF